MITIGIDPGLTGALSLITPGRLLECADIPVCPNGTASGSMRNWLDVEALNNLLATWSTRHGFATSSVLTAIERPIPMPNLPAQTIAAQFDTVGAIRAMVASRSWGRRLEFINPRAWKSSFGLGTDKGASRACALRLYPTAPVTRVKDHNRAESLLIAHYGMGKFA